VDKYQGQQNDYILLSLVRTHNIGHLRDVRRLVVAMSRARFGLYVYGRVNLFKNCFELTPAFNILTSRPVDGLYLCPNEVHPTTRQANVTAPNPIIMKDMPQICKFVYDFYAQKVAALADISRPTKSIPTLEGAKISEAKSEHKTSQHPGDDRDSDDEMEKKAAPAVFKQIVNEVP
jgi:intron-binding protein aquarius